MIDWRTHRCTGAGCACTVLTEAESDALTNRRRGRRPPREWCKAELHRLEGRNLGVRRECRACARLRASARRVRLGSEMQRSTTAPDYEGMGRRRAATGARDAGGRYVAEGAGGPGIPFSTLAGPSGPGRAAPGGPGSRSAAAAVAAAARRHGWRRAGGRATAAPPARPRPVTPQPARP